MQTPQEAAQQPQQDAWGGQQQYGQPGPGGQDEVKTLWVGDLQYWMDENYLWNVFAQTGEVQSVKVIRNKTTGQSEGYGFVELVTHQAAERLLQTYNGQTMPQSDQVFRMNWASFGINERRPEPSGPEHSIFVGDLANDVNDYVLTETFRSRYPSVKGAKVVTDGVSGRSKGYGFVRFGSEEERDRALVEMNGEYCSNRAMRISVATPKKVSIGPPAAARGPVPPAAQPGYGPLAFTGDNDPANTTIFVGGLDPTVSDDQLRASFETYGELVYVKIPYGKGCGFVQFVHRANAEEALRGLHGTVIGQQAVRLSWGRNPAAKQRFAQGGGGGGGAVGGGGWGAPQPDPNAWNQGYYGGYGQGYDPYAYGAPQDPNAYAYGGYYGGYQQQPQMGYGGPPIGGPSQASGPPRQNKPQGGYHQGLSGGGGERKDDETFDPTAPPNIEKMNQAYMVNNDPSMGHHLWLKPDQITA